jgi:hypothetical protein
MLELTYGTASIVFPTNQISVSEILSRFVETPILASSNIWLQGFQQTTSRAVAVSYLYFSTLSDTWAINMGILGVNPSEVDTADAEYTIYYYSY